MAFQTPFLDTDIFEPSSIGLIREILVIDTTKSETAILQLYLNGRNAEPNPRSLESTGRYIAGLTDLIKPRTEYYNDNIVSDLRKMLSNG